VAGILLDVFNKLVSNIKLLFQTFEDEVHLSGMSLSGSVTRVDMKFNDNTPNK
jgi:hypothetical protein